jgi:hypothetical protein
LNKLTKNQLDQMKNDRSIVNDDEARHCRELPKTAFVFATKAQCPDLKN